MSTMNMPGFTAEESLYRTSDRYRLTSSTHRVELNASLVQPSAAIYVARIPFCLPGEKLVCTLGPPPSSFRKIRGGMSYQ